MRFFTKEWLTGEMDDDAFEAVPDDYRRHVESLRLPVDVAALAQANLHDARLLRVSRPPASNQLTLLLRCGDRQRGYADLQITYVDAAIDDAALSVLHQAVENASEDLLQDEVDRAGARFEHRFILASHAEACVSFAAVQCTISPVPDRESEARANA